MSYELKLKSKSLAAEARIIRQFEVRTKGQIRTRALSQKPTDALRRERLGAYNHRIGTVRSEARATFIARAFLKGMAMKSVERSGRKRPLDRAFQIAKRYSKEPVDLDMFLEWANVE